uniref:Uncharacterized protein n=1 Tax=Schistocephalus solidus TaxID=70667 RepID=A0A0X3PGY3_SCHSO
MYQSAQKRRTRRFRYISGRLPQELSSTGINTVRSDTEGISGASIISLCLLNKIVDQRFQLRGNRHGWRRKSAAYSRLARLVIFQTTSSLNRYYKSLCLEKKWGLKQHDTLTIIITQYKVNGLSLMSIR